jgi:5-methyltetrahydrofolate--homocysteine methyltransferase
MLFGWQLKITVRKRRRRRRKMVELSQVAEALIKGQAPQVKELCEKALAEGKSPKEVLGKGLIAGMDVVGAKFKKNEFYVPEVLIAARAMHAGMDILKPQLAAAGVEPMAKIAIGTAKGDLHDIGKNLVSMMMEGAGFEVIDLGIDVPPEKFLEAVKDKKVQIVAMSALLTTTMPSMKTAIDAFKKEGVDKKVKTMIGGAPVTQSYADEIGADGYAPDAASAVEKAKELLNL